MYPYTDNMDTKGGGEGMSKFIKDYRKNVKVSPNVKNSLDAVKKLHGFKTESQAIAFLKLLHDRIYDNLTVRDYEKLKDQAKLMDIELTFNNGTGSN